jgi:hypothetical protein
MREVFDRLESLSVPYFLTGSEALARYGQPRQTMDVDIVVGIELRDFERLSHAFETQFIVNAPIEGEVQAMASLIATSALAKVDLMVGRSDPWSTAAMSRRERWDHPELGPLWVVSLEDLILAKLEWSSGVSELQLRDCRNLVVANGDTLDWPYLERWAKELGVTDWLAGVRDAT